MSLVKVRIKLTITLLDFNRKRIVFSWYLLTIKVEKCLCIMTTRCVYIYLALWYKALESKFEAALLVSNPRHRMDST